MAHEQNDLGLDLASICEKVIRLPDVEGFLVALILANCVTLAMYKPLEPGSPTNKRLEVADLIFNSLFTVEMLVKIIAARGIKGYLKSPWNIFDGGMVLVGYT